MGPWLTVQNLVLPIKNGVIQNLVSPRYRTKTFRVIWKIHMEDRKVFSDYQKGTS